MRAVSSLFAPACIATLLAACAPPLPNSGPGAGGTTAPPAAPLNQPLPAPVPVSQQPLDAGGTTLVEDPVIPGAGATAGSAQDIAAQTAAALGTTTPRQVPAPTAVEPGLPAGGSPAISDENDFGAVSERQTIESDAARIERLRQQRQVVAPTAVPERPGSSQPNIVSYALSTSNPRGTRIYSRSGLNLAGRFERNCADYASPDQAQIDFLARGGPQRDRKGIDPDGDGYACSWDPAPFRRAVQN